MRILDETRPFSTIWGYFAEVPDACFSQDGVYFNGAKIEISASVEASVEEVAPAPKKRPRIAIPTDVTAEVSAEVSAE